MLQKATYFNLFGEIFGLADRWMLEMKVLCLLEGITRPAKGRFAQRFADQLQAERDTVW